MIKPELPILSEEWMDYGLSQRVARFLERSHLHVCCAEVFSSVPEAIADADGPDTLLAVEFAMVTDGKRGWLVLTPCDPDYCAELEMTELVGGLLERTEAPPKVAVRAVNTHGEGPATALDLRDDAAAGRIIEAEFEAHFEGADPCELESLLETFRRHHYLLLDELALRQEMNQAA